MDFKYFWLLISLLFIKTTWARNEYRNMTDCYSAGIKCSRMSNCKFDTMKNNFTCFCVAGYMGDLCEEDRNECDIGAAPCRKRGVCHNSIGSFRCDCVPGWKGSHCQTKDGSVVSTCLTGYTGVNCTDDFDECTQWTENPCEHGSTCLNVPGSFTCSCVAGWEGRICNEDINECNMTSGLCHNGGNCTNTPGTHMCECPYPYTGPACNDVSSTIPTATTTSTITSRTRKLFTNALPIGMSTKPTRIALTSNGISLAGWSIATSNPTPVPSGPSTDFSASTSHHGVSNMTSPLTNTSKQIGSNGDKSGADGGGGTNVGAIAGPIAGILVIAAAAGAGFMLYNKFYRKHNQVDAANETEAGKTQKKTSADDSNKNTNWKPPSQNTTPSIEAGPVGNGVNVDTSA